MKCTSQQCCEKTVDDKMVLCRECYIFQIEQNHGK